MNLNVFFIKFVLCIKTNKDKSTKIITPLLLKPTDISARAMTRAKNSQQKLTILKKATVQGFASLEVIIFPVACFGLGKRWSNK